MKRDQPIDDFLYQDALNRKQKKEMVMQERKDQEVRNLTQMCSVTLSSNSEKYFIQKFTKELINVFTVLPLDEDSQTNETLSFESLKEFLIRMGFLDEAKLAIETSNEPAMLIDIFTLLGGQQRGHITLNNLRMFLLALMGTFVEPILKREEQELHIIEDSSIGQFNKHGDLFLEPSEVPRIQKAF